MEIEDEDVVVYCDIPYEGKTQDYTNHGTGERMGFDFEAFYEWAGRQKARVVVSSYQLPEDRFREVWRKNVVTSMGHSGTPRVERLYIPKGQKWEGVKELTLF